MRLDCYAVAAAPPRLAAACADRPWMDEFPARHAYRCLPLTIANTHGWELLSPVDVTIEWNGGPEASDIRFTCENKAFLLDHFVVSNFSRGIVTFHTGYLFQTGPGWNLLATGPVNRPKDGISPLTGMVETSWLPYPFTMNWQLTRAGIVRFEKDEPFCLVVPTLAQALSDFEPRIYRLESNPELATQYAAWRAKRSEFMAAFSAGDPRVLREAWQKFYFKGEIPDCDQMAEGHVQKLRLAEPVDQRADSATNSRLAPAVYFAGMSHPVEQSQGAR